jgi:hypothetical protein
VLETLAVLEPLLAKIAPLREGDENELPDAVVRE